MNKLSETTEADPFSVFGADDDNDDDDDANNDVQPMNGTTVIHPAKKEPWTTHTRITTMTTNSEKLNKMANQIRTTETSELEPGTS